eukprot:1193504-Prorocentrum_minimum.AAC.1
MSAVSPTALIFEAASQGSAPCRDPNANLWVLTLTRSSSCGYDSRDGRVDRGDIVCARLQKAVELVLVHGGIVRRVNRARGKLPETNLRPQHVPISEVLVSGTKRGSLGARIDIRSHKSLYLVNILPVYGQLEPEAQATVRRRHLSIRPPSTDRSERRDDSAMVPCGASVTLDWHLVAPVCSTDSLLSCCSRPHTVSGCAIIAAAPASAAPTPLNCTGHTCVSVGESGVTIVSHSERAA